MTLIEILVVIAVIGILFATSAPAIGRLRNTANRMLCSNNLKQFGIALHEYESSFGSFPSVYAATFRGRFGGRVGMHYYSVHSRLLPYLDHAEVFHAINFDFLPGDTLEVATNASASRTRLGTFLCPANRVTAPRSGGNIRVSIGNNPNSSGGGRGPLLGAFSNLDFVRATEITDGLAQTAFASERVRGFVTRGEVLYGMGLKDIAPPNNQPDVQLSICDAAEKTSLLAFDTGNFWIYTGLGYTTYNHVGPPNGVILDCIDGSLLDTVYDRATVGGMMSARSLHGPVNVLFGDGSVRSVDDSIALPIWRAYGTRSANDSVSP